MKRIVGKTKASPPPLGLAPVPPVPIAPLPPPVADLGPQIDHGDNTLQHVLSGQIVSSHHTRQNLDRLLLLSGRLACFEVQRRDRIRHFGDVEFGVTSQWGEDGIIEWLCARLAEIPRSFVEFGVENFSEANTRFLLQNRGWKGLIIDGNADYMRDLRQQALYWKHDLTAVGAFITVENINSQIVDNGFAGDIGILSVDIDGNDYWVLKAIDCVRPAIIIGEINGVFGDLKRITVPYRPDFERIEAHYSGQYFGCSIAALTALCAEKGFTFVGTNTNGVNAFYVRNDLAGRVLPFIDDVRCWPQRHRDSRDPAGELSFVRGLGKRALIADMPVVDLEQDRIVALTDLGELYGDTFREDFV